MNEDVAIIKIPRPLLDSLNDRCAEADTTLAELLAGLAIYTLTGSDDLLDATLDPDESVDASAWGFSERRSKWPYLEIAAPVAGVLAARCDRRGISVCRMLFGLHQMIGIGGPKMIKRFARAAENLSGLDPDEFSKFVREMRGEDRGDRRM